MLRTQTDLSVVYVVGAMICSEGLAAEYDYSRMYLGRYLDDMITSWSRPKFETRNRTT
jgi:hypothetical protein